MRIALSPRPTADGKLHMSLKQQDILHTLSDIGYDRKMPWKVVIQTGIDVCRGLQDVHAAGMVMANLSQVCTPPRHVLSSLVTADKIRPARLHVYISAFNSHVVLFCPSSLSFRQNSLHLSQLFCWWLQLTRSACYRRTS